MIDIQLKDVPLSTEECNQVVASAGAGGTVVFVGTVRDQTKGKN
ncbi:MAG: molybdenum cofactor biosynthesis protein MoaE, partial [Cyanothece sp. SIO1E1]|nr:molybdenum cofactor biosynthesis protein MoaE [Cyanothece sp. SIO1E1]